ncbi:MAG: hypothetical protein ACJ8GK_02490 [Luteimonas sp.]
MHADALKLDVAADHAPSDRVAFIDAAAAHCQVAHLEASVERLVAQHTAAAAAIDGQPRLSRSQERDRALVEDDWSGREQNARTGKPAHVDDIAPQRDCRSVAQAAGALVVAVGDSDRRGPDRQCARQRKEEKGRDRRMQLNAHGCLLSQTTKEDLAI